VLDGPDSEQQFLVKWLILQRGEGNDFDRFVVSFCAGCLLYHHIFFVFVDTIT
jgi:hypothetical protein